MLCRVLVAGASSNSPLSPRWSPLYHEHNRFIGADARRAAVIEARSLSANGKSALVETWNDDLFVWVNQDRYYNGYQTT